MKYIIFLLKLEDFWGRRRRVGPLQRQQYLFSNCLSFIFDYFSNIRLFVLILYERRWMVTSQTQERYNILYKKAETRMGAIPHPGLCFIDMLT